MNEILLKMENITKSFPGVLALDDVSLTVRRGTVHALMGENGAGKSTLMKCLFGVYKKDSGRITLDGREVEFQSSKNALDNGVAMVHQELNQAKNRSVMENIWLGRLPSAIKGLPFISESEMYKRTVELLESVKLNINPRAEIGKFSVSVRQMVEIAKAISYGAKIIVFDEPTSSLNTEEAEKLFEIIRMLKNQGCGIIYISHKMDEILKISDEVTVMRDGKHIATREAKALTTDEIIKLMVGRELSRIYPEKTNKIGDILFKAVGISSEYARLTDVSFELSEGEILGVAGLDGSGRTELLENIFGISTRRSGKLYLRGEEIQNKTPADAKRNGFALVTEERRATGIFSILGITENTVISSLNEYKKFGLLSDKKMRSETRKYIGKLKIKTPDEKTKIRNLSGGNQQKVIFSRWLLTKPKILLLDEPTRGIDVGAKFEIYQLIIKMASEGCGIIMVSSEMPELLGVCDRILVMSGGAPAGVVGRGTSQEEIMALATRYV